MLFDFSQKVYKEISRTGYNNKTKLIFWRVFQLFPHTLSLRLLQSQSLSATIPSKHPSTLGASECNIEHIQLKSLPLHRTISSGGGQLAPSAIAYRISEFRTQTMYPAATSIFTCFSFGAFSADLLSAVSQKMTAHIFWGPPFIKQGATNSWRLYYFLATPLPLMSIIIIGDPPMQNMQILE